MGGMQKEPHDKGEEVVGFISNNHGELGGDKRGKDKAWELDAHAKNLSRAPCLFRVPCMALRALCCLPVYPPFLRSSKQTQNPFSPTHTNKLTRAVPQGQRLTRNNNKQAEKQAG